MTFGNYATVNYPGINAVVSFTFTDCAGVRPAFGSMKIAPQYGLPQENGDIVMSYNGNEITIVNCHIDSAYYEQGSGGQIVNVKFLDERWAWTDTEITGRYNFRLPNNWVDPEHEKTPQQLATLCFKALGIEQYDVSSLPNESRPEVDWVHANPAQELDKLCNDLGCRVVPVRSSKSWRVCVTGEGENLPNGLPYTDAGQGIDPKETPDYIKIVTAPVRYQVSLPLSPRGRDLDLAYRWLFDLSYSPNPDAPDYGFKDYETFQDLATLYVTRPNGSVKVGSKRYTLPDGTKVSPMELAQDSVYRCWGLDFEGQANCGQLGNGEWGVTIPAIDQRVTVRQIQLTDKLVQTYTDYLGTQHERPSFVYGSFYGKNCEKDNYPYGTRIDKQHSASDQKMDERSSFSLSLDERDTTRSMIMTSSAMVRINPPDNYSPINYFTLAFLQYMCAIHVRDPETWQPYRYEYLHQIGNGTNKDFCRVVQKDDIQPWVIGKYKEDASTNQSIYTGEFDDNKDEVDSQCQYYAQSIAREYQTVTSETRTYIGLFAIDMDGAIQQVSYEIGSRGASTTASQGTEHSWVVPGYEERRQQVARRGVAEKLQYAKAETARREALKGRFNT